MSIKLDFAKQLKAQIDVWQAQIENAQGELEKVNARARADYNKTIAQLKERAEEARKLLEQVQKTNESTWNDMHGATHKAFAQLQKGWADAISRFT